MKQYKKLFDEIIRPETLFDAWKEFRKGKGRRPDVLVFEKDLEANIFTLANELADKSYRHGVYAGFYIMDPKLRHIHKASVRDRVLHHAIMKILNPIFEQGFMAHSFSCRVGKGTHKGVIALRSMMRKESRNNTRTCWVLKCDVAKFFDSIDHDVLFSILKKRIKDSDMLWLLSSVIESYLGERSTLFQRRGVPIGNLTSQLFANVYMNEFDQFMKHELHVRHYGRYTDDFVIVSHNRKYLEQLIAPIREFLRERLSLELHPRKVTFHKYHDGVDFLGYVVFPHHTLMRKRTKVRVLRKLKAKIALYQRGMCEEEQLQSTVQSYLGILSHANMHRFSEGIKNYVWFQKK